MKQIAFLLEKVYVTEIMSNMEPAFVPEDEHPHPGAKRLIKALPSGTFNAVRGKIPAYYDAGNDGKFVFLTDEKFFGTIIHTGEVPNQDKALKQTEDMMQEAFDKNYVAWTDEETAITKGYRGFTAHVMTDQIENYIKLVIPTLRKIRTLKP